MEQYRNVGQQPLVNSSNQTWLKNPRTINGGLQLVKSSNSMGYVSARRIPGWQDRGGVIQLPWHRQLQEDVLPQGICRFMCLVPWGLRGVWGPYANRTTFTLQCFDFYGSFLDQLCKYKVAPTSYKLVYTPPIIPYKPKMPQITCLHTNSAIVWALQGQQKPMYFGAKKGVVTLPRLRHEMRAACILRGARRYLSQQSLAIPA